MWDHRNRRCRPWSHRLNTLFVRYGCGTWHKPWRGGLPHVLIPYSSGMGVGPYCGATDLRRKGVLIPYSSGMGVGPFRSRRTALPARLNTLFVRYGCGTTEEPPSRDGSSVLIPYSSGMGVGPEIRMSTVHAFSLNTLFVRYGCGTRPFLRVVCKRKS